MRRRKSFTLVELLVVIAIIAILIAILIGVISKVRRRALVLVCPIAYLGIDRCLYLTGPRGGYELKVNPPDLLVTHAYGWHGGPVSWSPSGLRLAYNAYLAAGGSGPIGVIHEPMSGRTWRFPNTPFCGWVTNDTFLGEGYRVFSLYGPGTYTAVNLPQESGKYYFLERTPPTCDAPYTAAIYDTPQRHVIAYVRRDFTPGRVIWRLGDPSLFENEWAVKVDPTGEWVAWVRAGGGGDCGFKGTRDHSSVRPRPFGNAMFLDWTDDGNMLLYTEGSNYYSQVDPRHRLLVVSKDRKVLREVQTTVEPSQNAAYRKFEHR